MRLFLIGSRGHAAIAEQGIVAGWETALPSHSPGMPKLADRVVEAPYARIRSGELDALDVVFSQWSPGAGAEVVRQRLFPFDFTAFPKSINANPPLLNLEPYGLIQALAVEYMHAQLCRAGLHAFAAVNQARVEAMAAAQAG